MFSTALDDTYLLRETTNIENCRKNCAKIRMFRFIYRRRNL